MAALHGQEGGQRARFSDRKDGFPLAGPEPDGAGQACTQNDEGAKCNDRPCSRAARGSIGPRTRAGGAEAPPADATRWIGTGYTLQGTVLPP